MPPEEIDDELGVFGFGIRVVRRHDGRIEYQPHIIIKNVPIEIVMAQVEVFLEDLRKEYHSKYGSRPPPE